jgi:hypothetical protein
MDLSAVPLAGGIVPAFVVASRDTTRTLREGGDTVIDLRVARPDPLGCSCGMGTDTGRLTLMGAPG